MFLFHSTLFPYSYWWSSSHCSLSPHSHYYGDLPIIQPVLLNIFNESSPYLCSWSSTDIFNVLFMALVEGSRRACGTVFIKSPVVSSNVLGHHIHLPLPPWLTIATSSALLSSHGKCPTQVDHFLKIFYAIFLLYLFYIWVCLDTQIFITVLQLPTVLSTVTCSGLQPQSNRLSHTA